MELASHSLLDPLKSVVSLGKLLLKAKWPKAFPARTRPSAVILANGPSLKQDLEPHLDWILQHEVFAVNLFSRTEWFEKVKPRHYMMVDDAFWRYMTGVPINPAEPNVEVNIAETFQCIRDRVTWPMTIHMPYTGRNAPALKMLLAHNPNIRVHFFNHVVISGMPWFRHRLWAAGWGTPSLPNVLAGGIITALAMRFPTIYLLGADHSWHETVHLDEDGLPTYNDVHFYSKTSAGNPIKMRAEVHARHRIDTWFMGLGKTFRSYHLMRAYADWLGCRVINASNKSYIDAFERQTIASLKQANRTV